MTAQEAAPQASRPQATTPLPPDVVLARLHAAAAPRPKHPPSSATLFAAAAILHSPTTTASTISAILTALSHLPPSALPSSHTALLSVAVAAASHRARPVLTAGDLLHAANLLALLAARSDSAAASLHATGAAHQLLRSAGPGAPSPLRDALRRLAVVAGLSRAELTQASVSLRSRAGKLVTPRRPVRILAIDGGGTRAVLAAQVLHEIERLTGAPLRQSFDLIAGTSSGGVLAVATGLLGMSPLQCEELYVRFARDVLTGSGAKTGLSAPSGIYHAGKVLLLNRGMYDVRALRKLYKEKCGPGRLFEYAGGNGTPRVFALSTQIRSRDPTVRTPRPFLHANYRHATVKGQHPRYAHGCMHRLSDALSATTAAPVFFDAFLDEDGEAFCDGGVVMNNPTSVAIHEARRLWPDRPLGVVVSVGTGNFPGAGIAKHKPGDRPEQIRKESGTGATRGNGAEKGELNPRDAKEGRGRMALRVAQAVLESATDTEGVHHALEDLIGSNDVYFRLNPELEGEQVHLDEYKPQVLQRLIDAGRAYAAHDGAGGEILARLSQKLTALGRHGIGTYGLWRPKNLRSYARL